jgi:hypothetical protein
MADNVVEIKNGKYRYRYDPTTGSMKYLGPVGESPELDEDEFLALMELPELDDVSSIMLDVVKEEDELTHWKGQIFYIKEELVKKHLGGVEPPEGTEEHERLMGAVRKEMSRDMRKEYMSEMKRDLTTLGRKQWQMDVALAALDNVDWLRMTEEIF